MSLETGELAELPKSAFSIAVRPLTSADLIVPTFHFQNGINILQDLSKPMKKPNTFPDSAPAPKGRNPVVPNKTDVRKTIKVTHLHRIVAEEELSREQKLAEASFFEYVRERMYEDE